MLPGFRQVAESQSAEWSKLPEGVTEPAYVKQMRATQQYRSLSARTKIWWSVTLALVLATGIAFIPLLFAKWGVAALMVMCFAQTVKMAVRTAKAHNEAKVINDKASESIVDLGPETGPEAVGVEEAKA